jgi:hypothetical protein
MQKFALPLKVARLKSAFALKMAELNEAALNLASLNRTFLLKVALLKSASALKSQTSKHISSGNHTPRKLKSLIASFVLSAFSKSALLSLPG